MLEIVGSSQKYILNSRNEKMGLLINILNFFLALKMKAVTNAFQT
jgi:hypothetical protein